MKLVGISGTVKPCWQACPFLRNEVAEKEMAKKEAADKEVAEKEAAENPMTMVISIMSYFYF
jgi:hypothetical protein